MKPSRKVTARSDERSTSRAVRKATVKVGTRITIRNVKVGSMRTDVKGYVEKVGDGFAVVNTWGRTNPVRVPLSVLFGGVI